MQRLLIVRLGSLGDLVHTLPAASVLRRAHPDAEIDWLVDAAHAEFLSLVPIVSRVIVLRGRTAGAWLDARAELRSRRYDLALDFQGLIKSAALARLSGAARVVGFDRRALREGAAALFYTEQVDVGEGRHVIFKNLALASLGKSGEASPGPLDFPLREIDSAAMAAIRAAGIERYALINPGAAWPNKRWPPASFGAAAAHIRSRHGLTPVVLWGPNEAELAATVVSASSGSAVLAPPTDLADVIAVARRAELMLSGDTGPLHLAAAVGTPIVSVFGPTDPARNGPWAAPDEAIGRYSACACHYERQCRHADRARWCLGTIAVSDVEAAIDRRLA